MNRKKKGTQNQWSSGIGALVSYSDRTLAGTPSVPCLELFNSSPPNSQCPSQKKTQKPLFVTEPDLVEMNQNMGVKISICTFEKSCFAKSRGN